MLRLFAHPRHLSKCCLETDKNAWDTDRGIRWPAQRSGQQQSQRNGSHSLGEAHGNRYRRMRTCADANGTLSEEAMNC
jgi:hypothetical protein